MQLYIMSKITVAKQSYLCSHSFFLVWGVSIKKLAWMQVNILFTENDQ